MVEFNSVDIKNAARLIREHCQNRTECNGCVFHIPAMNICGLVASSEYDIMPRDWDFNKKEINKFQVGDIVQHRTLGRGSILGNRHKQTDGFYYWHIAYDDGTFGYNREDYLQLVERNKTED